MGLCMTGTNKKPLQVLLRSDQLDALRALAERSDKSIAALVREGVDRILAEIPPEEDPLQKIVGLFDGEEDLSENHDEYLAKMSEQEHQDGE